MGAAKRRRVQRPDPEEKPTTGNVWSPMLPVGSARCAWAAAGLRKHMFLDFTLGVGVAKRLEDSGSLEKPTTGNLLRQCCALAPLGALIADEKPTTGNDGALLADMFAVK